MKYFKCTKCKNIYCFPCQPPALLIQCGAYAGTRKIIPHGERYYVERPIGCGGQMIEISEEVAESIVDSMR